MLFNSYIFIFIFLPITLGVFFIIGRRSHYRIALGWLVAASLFFYGYWNPIYLLLIGSSMTVNFQIGRWLNRSPDFLPICRRSLLITGITVNLTVLGFFKYANFIADQLSYVSELPLGLPEIVLPLGISFFTFQKIAYLVDAYHGKIAGYSFLQYCLFVLFFPQLIAGPIVHPREILPQFANRRVFQPSYSNLSVGLTYFVLGLFKKVVLADRAGAWLIN